MAKQSVTVTLSIDPEKFERQRQLLRELVESTYDDDKEAAIGLCSLCASIAKQIEKVSKPQKIGRLRKVDKENFSTLQRAHEDGNLCLASSIRKSDGAKVALVCAVGIFWRQHIKDRIISPLAVMVEGDPYELFEDPTKGVE